jgi:hypothetical protein
VNASVTATVTPSEKDKIIYQYKLLKRIRSHPLLNLLYIGTIILWVVGIELLGDAGVWATALTTLAGWQLLSVGVTIGVLSHETDYAVYRGRHGWTARLPWIGYVPAAGVPFRLFHSVTMHLMIVGALIAGSVSVWLSADAAWTVFFLHIWLLLPRLFLVLRMNRSARGGAIISFQSTDVGLYSS